MKKMKKFAVWLIVFALMLTNCGIVFAEEAEPEATETAEVQQELTEMGDDCAYFDFGTMETQKINKYLFQPGQTPEQVKRDGRRAIRFTPEQRALFYLYIGVDDDYIYAPEGTKVAVQVDYFDEGSGYFTLQFDSVRGGDCYNSDDYIWMEDTKTWKTHEFYLPDACCTNRALGYDFRLAQWSLKHNIAPEAVTFGAIRIKKLPADLLTPSMESDYTGNIFDESEEKEIRVNMINNYGTKVNASFDVKIKDHDGDVVDEIIEDYEFEGDGVWKFYPDVTKYDCYMAEINIKATDNEGRTYEHTFEKRFSVSDKFYDGEVKNKYFGYSTHPDYINKHPDLRQKISDLIAQTGATVARWDMQWIDVEPKEKQYVVPNFADVLDTHKENGISSMVIFAASTWHNQFHYQQKYSLYPPIEQSAVDAYGDYIVWTLQTLKGKIKQVEIWNEYNAFPEDPATYANMLKSVYHRIKAVDPEIEVIGGVTSHVPVGWMRGVFEAGGYDYIDAWSIHPYDCFKTGDKVFDVSGWRDQVAGTKKLMAEFGEMKPLYLTELGWTNAPESKYFIPEIECCAYIIESFVLMRSEDLADLIINYDFQDDNLMDHDHNSHFGSVRYPMGGPDPLSAKLQYLAISNMNKFIGDAEVVDNIIYEDRASGAYRFKRNSDGKQFISAFSNAERKSVSLDLGVNSIDVYDLLGNKTGTLKSENGVFTVGLSNIPIWLSGDFTKLEQAETGIKINGNEFSTAAGEYIDLEIRDASGTGLSIEVTETELEVILNEGGRVRLKTKSGEIKDYPFNIAAYKNGELYYSGTGLVHAVPPIEVKTETEYISNRYSKVLIKVKNRSNYTEISGEAMISAPEDIAANANKVRLVNVKPQSEETYEIRLPEMKKRRMVNMETTVVLEDGYTFKEAKNYGFSSIKRAETAPKIDGIISSDEWKGVWYAADRKEDICEKPTWSGTDDLSLMGNLMWDDENLYMCVDATDDIFDQTYSGFDVWRADSVQFAFHQPGTYASDISEFALTKTPKGVELFRFNSNFGFVSDVVAEGEKAINVGNGKTVYELAIPWTSIFGETYKPVAESDVSFSIILNDCDGNGQRGWAQYGSGVGYNKNSALFVGMKLEK